MNALPDVFYDLDISVSTNRREAFGIVFIESLASYTPLVTFDSGGQVEILDKGGGVLVHGGADARQVLVALECAQRIEVAGDDLLHVGLMLRDFVLADPGTR